MQPCIPFSLNRCMSMSVRRSKSICVCLSKASKTSQVQCNSVKGQVYMHLCMFFRMFEKLRQLVAQHQSLGTSHDNRQVFYS